MLVAFLTTTVYGLGDSLLFESHTTLSEQRRMAREVIDSAGPDATIATIAAEEFLIFDALPSPYPFLRLKVGQDELTEHLQTLMGLNGCDWVVERTEEVMPVALVISGRDYGPNACVTRLADTLSARGYTRAPLDVAEARVNFYDARGRRPQRRGYIVYQAPGVPRTGAKRGGRRQR